MTFQEKKSLVFISTVILIFIYFWFNVFPRHPGADVSAEELLKFWGGTFLSWIGVQIVVNIITHIIFSIVNTIITKEKEPTIKDERDRLFNLRVANNSSTVFMIGFLLSMIPPVIGMPPIIMFYALVFSGLIAQIIGSLTEFISYRRGY